MKSSLPLMRTCQQASALMLAREDQQLPWRERLALRLHLAMCAACPRFERQLLTMRHAFKQWRHYANDESERKS